MSAENLPLGRFGAVVAARKTSTGAGDSPHLAKALGLPPAMSATRQTEETGDPLPSPDAPYRAFARWSNKPEFSLHFITPAGTIRSFQYNHLDDDSRYSAERLVLHFCGWRIWRVTIHGHNLRTLYDGIHHHRVGWVRVCSDAFAEEGEPLVEKVEIEEVRNFETG